MTLYVEEKATMQDSIDREKLLEKYLRENNTEAAVEILFDLIVKNAMAKNFSEAEQLREKLFEVDPMALDKIVKSAEIIETSKIAAIDPAHRDIWSHLYERLTTEEKIALYYGMKKANFEAEQIIFRQGEMNSNLYFINAGRLKMYYHRDKHGILLKTVGPGDIAGEDTFFSNSTCTFSIMADSPVKLTFLEKTVLQKWQDEVPSLASKLQGYCAELESINDLLQKKELERRAHRRYAVSGNATVQITADPDNKVFKVDLSDISASGVSFTMSTSSKAAESLLGRHLNLKLVFHHTFPELRIDQNGSIVGIHHQLFNDYLINVKWEEPLDKDTLERIRAHNKIY
jgi:CRP-like cAMP-binding protein